MGLIKTKEDSQVLRFLKKYVTSGSYIIQERLFMLIAEASGVHPSKLTVRNILAVVSDLSPRNLEKIDNLMLSFRNNFESSSYAWVNPLLKAKKSLEVAKMAKQIEKSFGVHVSDIVVSQGQKRYIVPMLSNSPKERTCIAIMIPDSNIPKCKKLNKIMKTNYDVIFQDNITSIHFYRLP